MTSPVSKTSVAMLHVLMISVYMMLSQVICPSRWQYIFPYKWLVADDAVGLVLLYYSPEEVLKPLLFLRCFDSHTMLGNTSRILIFLATVILRPANP